MTKTLKYEVKMTGYSLLLAAYRATGVQLQTYFTTI